MLDAFIRGTPRQVFDATKNVLNSFKLSNGLRAVSETYFVHSFPLVLRNLQYYFDKTYDKLPLGLLHEFGKRKCASPADNAAKLTALHKEALTYREHLAGTTVSHIGNLQQFTLNPEQQLQCHIQQYIDTRITCALNMFCQTWSL